MFDCAKANLKQQGILDDANAIEIDDKIYTLVSDEAIYTILCFGHSDWELLPFSTHCLTLSSIATALRLKAVADSFDGIIEALTSDEAMRAEISKCLLVMFDRCEASIRARE